MGEIRKNGKSAWIYGLVFILAMIVFLAFSWISTCGIIKLITLCFNWEFSWKYSTGIWLILCIITGIAQGRDIR